MHSQVIVTSNCKAEPLVTQEVSKPKSYRKGHEEMVLFLLGTLRGVLLWAKSRSTFISTDVLLWIYGGENRPKGYENR